MITSEQIQAAYEQLKKAKQDLMDAEFKANLAKESFIIAKLGAIYVDKTVAGKNKDERNILAQIKFADLYTQMLAAKNVAESFECDFYKAKWDVDCLGMQLRLLEADVSDLRDSSDAITFQLYPIQD